MLILENEFPELLARFGRSEGDYEAYGNLAILFCEQANTHPSDNQLLTRICSHIESLMLTENQQIRNLIAYGFLEIILDNEKALTTIRSNIGKQGKQLLEETELFWLESLK
ncbi:MAG: hypothetical protein H3C47_10710 [Candidatus Cloacimonetes bacterium]|nr:hypothetical protein [Candidatus Cloacimonadota bacterium]